MAFSLRKGQLWFLKYDECNGKPLYFPTSHTNSNIINKSNLWRGMSIYTLNSHGTAWRVIASYHICTQWKPWMDPEVHWEWGAVKNIEIPKLGRAVCTNQHLLLSLLLLTNSRMSPRHSLHRKTPEGDLINWECVGGSAAWNSSCWSWDMAVKRSI